MALTNSFYEAVKEKNKQKIRIMMKNSLLMDPSFGQFDEMEKAAASVGNLYDEHDGREFKLDKESWNDDYMNELMVQVVGNFSHERVNHLKDVVRYLRPVENKKVSGGTSGGGSPKEENLSYQEQKRRDQLNGTYRGTKIAAGAVAGAVVGGAIAVAVEAPVVLGVAVGAGIAGGAVYMVTEGNG